MPATSIPSFLTSPAAIALWQAYEVAKTKREAQRADGWRALRVARTLGYMVEKCRESGWYYIICRRDDPTLVAAGWSRSGPVYSLEGR